MRFKEILAEANLPQAGGLPQAKQPKLKLSPLVKGLAYHWFIIYYGLHHADEPEIVNDRAGYAAELDKITKTLGQQGFTIQWVDDLPDLGDGGGGEGVYLTHVASKQTVGIDGIDLDQDYQKFLPLAHKAVFGNVSETNQHLDPKRQISEDTQTFSHVSNKKLRRILVSGPKNSEEVEWAMDFTHDALMADYDDEMIPSSVYDARNNAYISAEESFDEGEGDLDATLEHIRQFWRV